MADIETVGIVEWIKVGDDFGYIAVREEETGTIEYFFVWSTTGETSAYERILQSMHLSMLGRRCPPPQGRDLPWRDLLERGECGHLPGAEHRVGVPRDRRPPGAARASRPRDGEVSWVRRRER